MENVILIIHLVLAVSLIGVVLLQRSEGGGLGTGGATGGVMTGRAAATAMSKATWILAIAFLSTSIGLTIIAASNSANSSVLDRLRAQPEAPLEADPLVLDPNDPLGLDTALPQDPLTPTLD